jgi:hypothetical protein
VLRRLPGGAIFRLVASGLLVGNWKRVMPTLFQVMLQRRAAVSKTR